MGVPGIGKTSLWRAVADSQPVGVVVLRTTGVQGGQAGLANLADLLDPVAGMVLPRLPEPQASALRAALGLAAAEMPLGGDGAGAGGGRLSCAAWLSRAWWSPSMTSSGWIRTAAGCWRPLSSG